MLLDAPRNLAILGVLLGFLAIFLAWFDNGTNLISGYYSNGTVNLSSFLNSTNAYLTLTLILYPIGLIVGVAAVWRRDRTPWQALVLAPSVVWAYYQFQQGLTPSGGPLLALAGGVCLSVSYYAGGRMHSVGQPRRSDPRNWPKERERSRSRLGPYHRRFRLRSVRGIIGVWALAFAITFIAGASYPIPEYVWVIPLLLSLYLGSLVGYRVWQYALSSGRYGVESIWKTRILMTLGLLVTGGFLFSFLFGATLATFTVPYSTSASYQQVCYPGMSIPLSTMTGHGISPLIPRL